MTENCLIYKMMPEDNRFGHVITKGFVAFNHWHNDYEYVYVVYGSLTIEIDSEIYIVDKGECLIINSLVVHSFISVTPQTEILVARIAALDLCTILSASEIVSELFRNSFIIRYNPRIELIMHDLVYANYGEMNELFTTLKASEMAIEIANNPYLIEKEICAEMVELSDSIHKMEAFIEENLTNGVTLTMVAEHLGYSSSYCSRYIKKKTNLNYLEYVNSIRMVKSDTLLRTSEKSVTEIAFDVGFTSIQNFNRVFKKYRGVTPTEYRQSLRSKSPL